MRTQSRSEIVPPGPAPTLFQDAPAASSGRRRAVRLPARGPGRVQAACQYPAGRVSMHATFDQVRHTARLQIGIWTIPSQGQICRRQTDMQRMDALLFISH